MTDHQANTKFIEIVNLLGLQATYHSGGIYSVHLNGQYIGQMSAESWLDHLRVCMAKAKRC